MKKWWSILLVFPFLLAGCGGGSSSPSATATVSGVAAAGAPLSGAVSLVDSQGNPSPALTSLLDADGRFSFDVTGLVPPFFLKADGVAGNTSYQLHSVVTGAGRANVNPLTEAQVKVATGKDPAALYADPASAGLTNDDMQVALDQAANDLKTMLQPLLDAWQAPVLNPITDVYVADGTGVDKLFDVADVSVGTNDIQVVDRASQTTLAAATVDAAGGMTTTDTIDATEVTQTTAVASDLDQIKAYLADWLTAVKTVSAKFVAGGYATQQDALNDLAPYYEDAQAFGIDNGQTLDQELAAILNDSTFYQAIKSISNVSIASSSNGVYVVNMVLTLQLDGAAAQYPVSAVALTNVGGVWKKTGNGFYAKLSMDNMDLIDARTERNVFTDQTTQYSGFYFQIDDNQQVFSAVNVTGPGLPQGGLNFSPNPNDWDMQMDPAQMACRRYNSDQSCQEQDWNVYPLNDATLASMPQTGVYTFTFDFADGSPSEVHKVTVPAKPLPSSQITDAYFPVVNSPAMEYTLAWAETNLLGQTVDFNYSTPTAFTPLHVGFGPWFDYSSATTWGHIESWTDNGKLGTNQTQSLTMSPLPAGATLEYGDFEIGSEDSQWRTYQTIYYFR